MSDLDLARGLGPVRWTDTEAIVRSRLHDTVEIAAPPEGIGTPSLIREGDVDLPGIVRFKDGKLVCIGLGATGGKWSDSLTQLEAEKDSKARQEAFASVCRKLGLAAIGPRDVLDRQWSEGVTVQGDCTHLEFWRR